MRDFGIMRYVLLCFGRYFGLLLLVCYYCCFVLFLFFFPFLLLIHLFLLFPHSHNSPPVKALIDAKKYISAEKSEVFNHLCTILYSNVSHERFFSSPSPLYHLFLFSPLFLSFPSTHNSPPSRYKWDISSRGGDQGVVPLLPVVLNELFCMGNQPNFIEVHFQLYAFYFSSLFCFILCFYLFIILFVCSSFLHSFYSSPQKQYSHTGRFR